MSDQAAASRTKRTAVLVVHGMGSQRAMDTVRGIVDAVWRDADDPAASAKRVWVHPERSGADIDLNVMATNEVPGASDERTVHFHELYWAHQMSETRAVAVLLWLFELARRGPLLRKEMKAIWWGVAIFLAFCILSVSFLAVHSIVWMSDVVGTPQVLVYIPLLMWFISAILIFGYALKRRASRIAGYAFCVAVAVLVLLASRKLPVLTRLGFEHRLWLSFILAAVPLAALWWCPKPAAWVKWLLVGMLALAAIFFASLGDETHAPQLTNTLLPIGIAAAATYVLMGIWGLKALVWVYAISLALHAAHLWFDVGLSWSRELIPWRLDAPWSAVAAWTTLATYLVLHAGFLQAYIGDVARYFRHAPGNVAVRRQIRRQAVDTLEALHKARYDRIVVVAHSLGTVVAYDMLRAYFGRVSYGLPTDEQTLGAEFVDLDRPEVRQTGRRQLDRETFRRYARTVVGNMARAAAAKPQQTETPSAESDERDRPRRDPKAWLVTDFVTLGSPLTHVHYLLCRGNSLEELTADFQRKVQEREFPVSPPARLDKDGLLTFEHPATHARHFHQAALFGLTRWTNLYFPLFQVLWGDAVGGPVAATFKPLPQDLEPGIIDVMVCTRKPTIPDFFAHTEYWSTTYGRDAPHIVALKNAIDLADEGKPNSEANFRIGGPAAPTQARVTT